MHECSHYGVPVEFSRQERPFFKMHLKCMNDATMMWQILYRYSMSVCLYVICLSGTRSWWRPQSNWRCLDLLHPRNSLQLFWQDFEVLAGHPRDVRPFHTFLKNDIDVPASHTLVVSLDNGQQRMIPEGKTFFSYSINQKNQIRSYKIFNA